MLLHGEYRIFATRPTAFLFKPNQSAQSSLSENSSSTGRYFHEKYGGERKSYKRPFLFIGFLTPMLNSMAFAARNR